jgi:integrase
MRFTNNNIAWNIDLEAGTWQVPIENAKTAKPHIVYLSNQAVALLVRTEGALAG